VNNVNCVALRFVGAVFGQPIGQAGQCGGVFVDWGGYASVAAIEKGFLDCVQLRKGGNCVGDNFGEVFKRDSCAVVAARRGYVRFFDIIEGLSGFVHGMHLLKYRRAPCRSVRATIRRFRWRVNILA